MLGVSTSGYYDWTTRKESNHAREDVRLLVEIKQIHQASREAYGSLKTWKALQARGVSCGKHRVARLRRIHGIHARRRKRFQITTDSKHAKWISPNRLNRSFNVKRPNEVWVGDVTFIATRKGWLHLAVIIDLYSRKVIGWSMSIKIDKHLVLSALDMALVRRQPSSGVLHHTDRGAIYASDEYQDKLSTHGLVPSMSRKGDCYDNAVAESFFSTLKNELVLGSIYESREKARAQIFEFIEVFYNRQRLHQSLNYKTPDEVERLTVSELKCPSNPG